MPRYKLTIEYDGSNYCGWQEQANGSKSSIQQSIQEAILKFTGDEVKIFVAGRTDAGVHAIGQVAHLDLAKTYKASEVMGAINYFLKPEPIVIKQAEIVADDFHARFSARKRRYLYRIFLSRTRLVLENNRAWQLPSEELDISAMQVAAESLLGKHDFTSFRAKACQATSPIITLDQCDVTQIGNQIQIEVSARSFLHHMVRNIVGALVMVGSGKWQPEYIQRVLEAQDRATNAATAPAEGLYLVRVDY